MTEALVRPGHDDAATLCGRTLAAPQAGAGAGRDTRRQRRRWPSSSAARSRHRRGVRHAPGPVPGHRPGERRRRATGWRTSGCPPRATCAASSPRPTATSHWPDSSSGSRSPVAAEEFEAALPAITRDLRRRRGRPPAPAPAPGALRATSCSTTCGPSSRRAPGRRLRRLPRRAAGDLRAGACSPDGDAVPVDQSLRTRRRRPPPRPPAAPARSTGGRRPRGCAGSTSCWASRRPSASGRRAPTTPWRSSTQRPQRRRSRASVGSADLVRRARGRRIKGRITVTGRAGMNA